MKNKKYCVGTVPKPNSKRGHRGRDRIIHNWISVESGVKHHEPQTTANSKIVERVTINTPNKDNVKHLHVRMSYYRTTEIICWTHKGHSRNTENTREGHF